MNAARDVGRVVLLARYPVKSTAGEILTTAELDERGFRHDREWAMYLEDGGIVSGKTSKRFRKVEGAMRWRSRMVGDHPAVPHLCSPDGVDYAVTDPAAEDALSRAFGRTTELRREGSVPHHDDCGVHLVTTSSRREVERAVGGRLDLLRTRPNIVLETAGDGFVEDSWVGAELAIGPDVVLRLDAGMPRCVMVDQDQADVDAQPPVLKTLGAVHDVILGLQATVVRPGRIALGDVATLRG